jgi:hypothetical protein
MSGYRLRKPSKGAADNNQKTRKKKKKKKNEKKTGLYQQPIN